MPNYRSGRDIVFIHTHLMRLAGEWLEATLETQCHHYQLWTRNIAHVCGMHPCVHMCGGQRLMLGIFLYCFVPYFLGTGNPIFHLRLDWLISGDPCLCLLDAEVTDKDSWTQLFTGVLGIELGFSHLCSKQFINWAITPATDSWPVYPSVPRVSIH